MCAHAGTARMFPLALSTKTQCASKRATKTDSRHTALVISLVDGWLYHVQLSLLTGVEKRPNRTDKIAAIAWARELASVNNMGILQQQRMKLSTLATSDAKVHEFLGSVAQRWIPLFRRGNKKWTDIVDSNTTNSGTDSDSESNDDSGGKRNLMSELVEETVEPIDNSQMIEELEKQIADFNDRERKLAEARVQEQTSQRTLRDKADSLERSLQNAQQRALNDEIRSKELTTSLQKLKESGIVGDEKVVRLQKKVEELEEESDITQTNIKELKRKKKDVKAELVDKTSKHLEEIRSLQDAKKKAESALEISKKRKKKQHHKMEKKAKKLKKKHTMTTIELKEQIETQRKENEKEITRLRKQNENLARENVGHVASARDVYKEQVCCGVHVYVRMMLYVDE
jgi:hypothetical protein